ncbi:MAG TPA: glycosyltransferase family 39 protein [Phycisphaerae bacterium]|nr:glycosyltransferase family 39 protein [Phycisphaerae bacterium]
MSDRLQLERTPAWSGRNLAPLVLLLAAFCSFGGLLGGPALGDHEALVAVCARQMRLTGDWIVPHFLDTPFIRKPPLGYWLVALSSYVLPADNATGLPVNEVAARLPSALAALGTVLLLWKLGATMFSRRIGRVAAVTTSASIFLMLYAVNATVEMLLTFCCTWAFAHFWFAIRTRSRGRRFVHMMLFYLAFGMAMLAKGPAPVAVLAAPLAWWWYTYRAQMVINRRGPQAVRLAGAAFVRSLYQQTGRAFTRLWVFPGIVLFAVLFIPWMFAVAQRQPHAWYLWNWQYLQRAQGDYADTRPRGYFYYVPMFLGLLLPWTLALGEAVVAPWMQRYRRQRKALYFVGCWAVVGVLTMSLMAFKKPYYILPALPGFLLLMAPVIDRYLLALRDWSKTRQTSTVVTAIGVVTFIGALGAYAGGVFEGVNHQALLLAALIGGVCGLTAWLCRVNRPGAALLTLAFGTGCAFLTGWYVIGPEVNSITRTTALDKELDAVGVPVKGPLYWADQRPDSRLGFYYGRSSEHLLEPAEIVTRMVDRTKGKRRLELLVQDRAIELLAGADPVYLILDRKNLPSLDMLPRDVVKRVKIVGAVDLDGKPDGEDWVIVSNRGDDAGQHADAGTHAAVNGVNAR